jgi:hypothetical protein
MKRLRAALLGVCAIGSTAAGFFALEQGASPDRTGPVTSGSATPTFAPSENPAAESMGKKPSVAAPPAARRQSAERQPSPEATTRQDRDIPAREDLSSSEGLVRLTHSRAVRYPSETFTAAVDSIFEDEVRSASWASPLEREIASTFPPMHIVGGSCKASLCRYAFRGSGSHYAAMDSLQGLRKQRGLPVSVFALSTAEDLEIVYIFSASPPAQYAQILQEMLPLTEDQRPYPSRR